MRAVIVTWLRYRSSIQHRLTDLGRRRGLTQEVHATRWWGLHYTKQHYNVVTIRHSRLCSVRVTPSLRTGFEPMTNILVLGLVQL